MRPLPMLARAARLRCPHCGVGRVMRSWLAVAERCPECGLRFERDEENEYWLGAYLLNFIVTEVVFAVLLLGALLATWPSPPVTPIVFYPFAKALWLAPRNLGSREPG